MTYALTHDSTFALGKALRAGASAATVYLEHPATQARADLTFEEAAGKLAVSIAMEHGHHTLHLQAGDTANAQHIREQLEAIANGTADTAETGAIGTPTAPAREPFALDAEDEASLRHLVRIGGTRHLQCGVSITVHNASILEPHRHALVTTQTSTEHLQAGTPGELYAVAAQHIEAALNAA